MTTSKSQADFKTLVETYQEKVRNTCFRFLNNIEDAEDVSQEVFIQVYESIDRFRDEAKLSTWIYRIAVNKSLDLIRRKKRKKRFAVLTSLFGSGEDNKELEPPALGNPQKSLEDKEHKKILNWAVSNLPDNQKTAITLSKYEGFSNKEIAEIMNISLSALEALIHRAKQNLRKQLYAYFEEREK